MRFIEVVKGYNRVFWVSNIIELFERWAWYGFYMALALFLVGSKDTGALGLTLSQKSIIMGTGSMLLYFLPVFTGAIADKIGYKRVLFIALTLYFSGYFMIMHSQSFEFVFLAFIWICIGGAFFKPVITAMISRNTTTETSSIGFGIFYMMVNIGSFIGPFIAGILLQKSWNYIFYMSMTAISLNFILTFLFFREPAIKKTAEGFIKAVGQVLKNIFIMLANWKYILFLLIISLFWTVYNQLYYSFPIFMDQWVDTKSVYNGLHSVWPWLALKIGVNGSINAVTMTSMVAFFIIVFQLVVSTFVMRFRPLTAMTGGILVFTGGLSLMFSNNSGWLILLGILIFGLGEMASSPKITEYIGLIAPVDKKALYMGTSYLPIAIGHALAGVISGNIFEKIADKNWLLQLEIKDKGLALPTISENFSKNDLFNLVSEKLGLSPAELTSVLWRNYHPNRIWLLYSGIAILAVILLWGYNRFILKKGHISL